MSEHVSALDQLDNLPLSEVTDEHVVAALVERSREMTEHGGIALPLDHFWQADALDQYRAAAAWWPTDAPQNCALPTLRELCLHVAGSAGATLLPAMAVLRLMADRAVHWLQSEGRSAAAPNETPEDRRRRLSRERVRRHRDVVREVEGEGAAGEVRRLYAAYIEACRVRKAAAAEHDDRVSSAKAAWEAAKAALSEPASSPRPHDGQAPVAPPAGEQLAPPGV
jgi:hypothetical protein